MAYLIYKHTNKFNGKSYIGQTSQKVTRRWRNGYGYKDSSIFYAAIQKYGFDNFSHEIIEENIKSKELANQREQFWIAHYNTWIYDPNCKGYNSTKGGTCNNTTALQKKVFQLDETKNIISSFDSISDAARAINSSPDRIARCCRQQKGYLTAGNFYWCFAADYEKYHLKLRHKKQPKELKGRATKAVSRVDSFGTVVSFQSVSEAAQVIGVERSQISAACRSKTHKLHNYFWYYKEDYENEKRKNSN